MRVIHQPGFVIQPENMRMIRAHGNGAEWLPLQIVLLLMLELGGGGSTMLHVAGGTVLGARLLQVASHLLRAPTGTIGATLTYLVTAGMAGWAVWMRFA